MIYQWRVNGLVPVPANVAGAEFERIAEEKGRLDPEDVVEASKSEDAPLHCCFEWDDAEAAREYRLVQAKDLIRLIVTIPEKKDDDNPEPVRAFISTRQYGYQPLTTVLSVPDLREEMLRNAMRDMEAFTAKYKNYSELEPIIGAITVVKRQLVADNIIPDKSASAG